MTVIDTVVVVVVVVVVEWNRPGGEQRENVAVEQKDGVYIKVKKNGFAERKSIVSRRVSGESAKW